MTDRTSDAVAILAANLAAHWFGWESKEYKSIKVSGITDFNNIEIVAERNDGLRDECVVIIVPTLSTR